MRSVLSVLSVAAVLCAVLSGCGKPACEGNGCLIDGGSDGGSGSGPRTVTFSNTVRRTSERGTVGRSQLADAGIALFLLDGGAWVELPGTRTDTSFVVNEVPRGDYVIQEGSNFYVASTDTLDVGYDGLGRHDVEQIQPGGLKLTLAVSGMSAWSDDDYMVLFSPGANLYGDEKDSILSGLSPGNVPTSIEWDYAGLQGSGSPWVDKNQGDTLWALYLKTEPLVVTQVPDPAGGTIEVPYDCSVLTRVAHVTDLTRDPASNTAAGTASFVSSPTRSVAINHPRTQWVRRAPELHPRAVAWSEEMWVASEPVEGGASADLASCSHNNAVVPAAVVDINRAVTAVNPFPANWKLFSMSTHSFFMHKSVGDAGTWRASGSITSRIDVDQPLVPQMHSPRQLAVTGVAAAELSVVAADQPLVVTWAPPEAGPAPQDYLVTVLSLSRVNGGTAARRVALALTRGTSFTFPVGTLHPEGVFYVRVGARVGARTESAPFRGSLTSTADAFTNPFLAE